MKTSRGSCLKPRTSLKTNKPRLKLFLWNRIEAGPVRRAIWHHSNAWKWHCWFGVLVRVWAVLWEAFSLLCPLEGSKWGKRCRRFFVICVKLLSFGCVLDCFLQCCPSCHGCLRSPKIIQYGLLELLSLCSFTYVPRRDKSTLSFELSYGVWIGCYFIFCPLFTYTCCSLKESTSCLYKNMCAHKTCIFYWWLHSLLHLHLIIVSHV